jgi:two-component system C4-dicarboxylate transport sensor histidine kinase DctB
MPRFRSLPLLFVCLLLVGLSGFSAYRIGQRLGIADLQATGLHRLDLYATSLEREIGKYAFLPGTLSLAPEVIDLLAGGGDGARVNAYLEKLNERAGTLSIYVMDTQGKVLATSNWRRRTASSAKTCRSAPISARRWRTAAGASSASAPRAASRATTWPRR